MLCTCTVHTVRTSVKTYGYKFGRLDVFDLLPYVDFVVVA
jgi:hypothetical protein